MVQDMSSRQRGDQEPPKREDEPPPPKKKAAFCQEMLKGATPPQGRTTFEISWDITLHVAKKKGPEKCRVCVDYCKLNAITTPDRYPVPDIGNFSIRLDEAKEFTTMDIKCAYRPIPVATAYVENTVIITRFVLFEYVSMLFVPRTMSTCHLTPVYYLRVVDQK